MSLIQTRDPVEANLFLTEPRSERRRQKIVHEFQRKPRIELVPVIEYQNRIKALEAEVQKLQEESKGADEVIKQLKVSNKREKERYARANALYGPFSEKRQTRNPESYPKLDDLIKDVAKRYGVSVMDIKSQRRGRAISEPRKEFFYQARMKTLRSYPEIGRFCGDRDHTTVYCGAKDYAKRHNLKLP